MIRKKSGERRERTMADKEFYMYINACLEQHIHVYEVFSK